MAKSIILWSFIWSTSWIHAQYSSQGELVSRFRPGVGWFVTGWKPAVPEKVRKYDRLIFDVTYNTWNGDTPPFTNHWASIGLNTNWMWDIPLTKGNTVALGIGIGHSWQNIRQDKLLALDSTSQSVVVDFSNTNNADKSRLSGHAFSLPLELRFRAAKWKHLKLHLGGKIGYQASWALINSYSSGNANYQIKQRMLPDREQLIYSAHLRFGLRNWALYGQYQFNPIFKSETSFQANIIQLGLSISLF